MRLPELNELPAWERAEVRFDDWLCEPDSPLGAPAAQMGASKYDHLVGIGLDHATRDGKRGRMSTGVRAWFAFVEEQGGLSPARPMEAHAPLFARLQEEQLAMRFVCSLIEERGVEVSTAAGYWSQVQGWHAREYGVKIGAGIRMQRLPQMLRGLRRHLGESERKVRRGIAPQMLAKAFASGLSEISPAHSNVRAAMACALQGLLRVGEYCVDGGVKWNRLKHLTRADIIELSDDCIVLRMHALKGKALSGKHARLTIGGGGEYIDAVREVANMLRRDPVPPGVDPDSVPLFRVAGTFEPLRSPFIRAETKRLMALVGEEPSEFNTHSFRIGGATALFAAGADMTAIKTLGRWSSDIYQLYVRACRERCIEWTRKAGSQRFTDVDVTVDEVADY